MAKIKFFVLTSLLFFSIPLFASTNLQEDLSQKLPLYEQLVSNKLNALNNCRHTCIAHCRTANGSSCGAAPCRCQ